MINPLLCLSGFIPWIPHSPTQVIEDSHDYQVLDETETGTTVERNNFFSVLTPLLEANKRIPSSSFCNLPEAQVRIKTIPRKMSYIRQYDLPPKLEEVLDETMSKWLADGVITKEPSTCTFNTPILFVPKKDANGNVTSRRPVLDLHHINNILVEQDRFPHPLIKDVLQDLNGAKVVTRLDIKSAFHKLPIPDPEDQAKLAFTHRGMQYCFWAHLSVYETFRVYSVVLFQLLRVA